MVPAIKKYNLDLDNFIFWGIATVLAAISLGSPFFGLPWWSMSAIITLSALFLYQLTHKKFLITLLIVGLVTFFSNFSKLNLKIGSIPIYVTEGVILVTILTLLLQGLVRGRLSYVKVPLQFEFFLLYLILFISLLRGIFLYDDKAYVLRQSAIFYYSIFYFLVPILFNSLRKIENLFKIIFSIYLIMPIIGFLGFAPFNLGFFSYFYCFITIIFELFYISLLPNKKYKIIFLIAIIVQFASFVLTQARAAWMGSIAAIVFIFYLSFENYLSVKFIRKMIRYTFFCGIILFSLVILLKPKLVIQLFVETASTFLIPIDYEDVKGGLSINTAKWRLYVWKDIINETLQKPILGWGFGKKFVPPTIKALGWGGSWQEEEKGWQDPHNSFLSIFHRTGIVGLVIFLLVMIKFIHRSLKFVKVVRDTKTKMLILASLTSIIYILGVSFFMVVLEGPYLGISLWFLMGLVVSLERTYKKEMAVQYAK